MKREDVMNALRRELQPVLEDRGVIAAYLFGSWAREEATENSDIDLGVFLHDSPALSAEWPPEDIALEGLLAARTSLPVEVHVLNDAPLSISGRVLEEGFLLYCGDEVARVRLEVAIRGQYLEFKPRLAELRKARLRAFAERGLR